MEKNDLTSAALKNVSKMMNFTNVEVMSGSRFYKRRKQKEGFTADASTEETIEELSREEVLRMNKTYNKYSRKLF